jgi:diguanylate cyclase (GGDEF)-like protein
MVSKEGYMLPAAVPADENTRLDTLRALSILDTLPEERFDRLTRLARRMFGVSFALVSLVDANRQWFKSCMGLTATETPRDVSFCAHAILGDDILLVPDTGLDERFHDNPLVTGAPNIRFYAGCPLTVANGSRLGTLCLFDDKPRTMDDEELAILRDLAHMAEQELNAIQLATLDELTQISNRRGFELLAQHALSMCHRLGKPASLLFFDLNGFKQINDTYGHAEGDRALVAFADVLRNTFRESDVIGRLGGDEFVALLTAACHDDTDSVLRRFQDALDERNRESSHGYDIRYSVGRTAYDGVSGDTIAGLLAEADKAMYSHKRMSK